VTELLGIGTLGLCKLCPMNMVEIKIVPTQTIVKNKQTKKTPPQACIVQKILLSI